MAARRRILIADRDVAFAATLKQAIERSGLYQVTVAGSAAIALDAQAAAPFDLAILDLGLEDLQGAELIRALRRQQPDLRIIVSPRDPNVNPEELAALDIQGVLHRPVAFAELPALIAAALVRSPAPPARPPRTEAVIRAARQLQTITLEAGAEAALLTETGELVAHTGRLPREEVEALAALVTEGWRENGGAPIGNEAQVRFVRLKPDGPDYLLYSAPVINNAVLSLVFHAETPLSVIRGQARRISERLRHAPEAEAKPSAAGQPVAGLGQVVPPLEVIEPGWEREAEAPARPAERPRRPQVPPEERPAPAPPTSADPFAEARRTGHSVYHLSYALVWLPRFPTTQLVGDLAERLTELIQEIARGYGWEVRYLEVQPEYVHVVIAAGPDDAAAAVVETFKRLTTETIFAEFPRLRQRHLAGQLWAEDYLALAASTPLTPDQVRRYIAYVRQPHPGL
jgi:REP element-mobilizing transposase RayT/DNA-binding response OmpR family regulator